MMNNVGQDVFVVVLSLVLMRSVYDLFMFVLAITWLRKSQHIVTKVSAPEFIVVIAVLWEQKTLHETVATLLSSSYRADALQVVIVTTEKEFTRKFATGTKSTVDVAKQLQALYPNRVHHLHYPHRVGAKAEQMNFAVDSILATNNSDDHNTFVVFYDADSRPHPETFSITASMASCGLSRVFQQSTVFLANFEQLRERQGLVKGALLQANAVLQTRWTLTHEVPRLLRQTYALRRWHRRVFLTHCVGHGLFIRKDLLRDIRQIPTTTMTEDLFLGFVLSLRGERIQALPILELADMPSTPSI